MITVPCNDSVFLEEAIKSCMQKRIAAEAYEFEIIRQRFKRNVFALMR